MKSEQSFLQIDISNMFTTFFLDHSNIFSKSFIQSIFYNFLSTPIVIEESELILARKTITHLQYADHDKLTVIGCSFINCEADVDFGDNKLRRGGAIRFVSISRDSNVTIYSSTFDK